MRLWHKDLIHYLPRQQLLGQHRECCALRGKGWGKKHSVIDYVFKHPYVNLYKYHREVITEMLNRGYSVKSDWIRQSYRGQIIGTDTTDFTRLVEYDESGNSSYDYDEHDDDYLKECLDNLKSKGVELVNGTSIDEQLLLLTLRGNLTNV